MYFPFGNIYLKRNKPKPYSYFDTPEGEDIPKKLWYVLRPTTIIYIYCTTCDLLLYSKPVGSVAILKRFAHLALPFFTVPTAYVLVSNSLVNLREKDDVFNWVAGAASSGVMMGIWKRRLSSAFFYGGFFAAFAAIKKLTMDAGFDILPTEERFNRQARGVWAQTDWSLVRDPRK